MKTKPTSAAAEFVEKYSFWDGFTLDASERQSPYTELFCYFNGIDIAVGNNITATGRRSEIFDNVYTDRILDSTFEYKQAADEIFRVLKPGGVLIMSLPFIKQKHGTEAMYREFVLKVTRILQARFLLIEAKSEDRYTLSQRVRQWVRKLTGKGSDAPIPNYTIAVTKPRHTTTSTLL